MDWIAFAERLLQGGIASLGSYLAAHVLLCLVPAFFIAGGLAALVPKESVTRYLGWDAPRYVAYPAAVMAGSTLAVCSCTIVPLFAGIYRKGAGLGPAMTFLFFAPAGNILALAYTGAAIGSDFAIARVILSLVFGIGIGMIMATLFHGDDLARAAQRDDGFVGDGRIARRTWWLLGAMLALLVFGTLKVSMLLDSHASVSLPIVGTDRLERALFDLAPYDPAKGEEGVTLHGAFLIVLLLAIAPAAWKGLTEVDVGYNRWTWVALGLVAATLLVAALRIVPGADQLIVEFPGKFFGVVAALGVIAYLARTRFEAYEVQQWLWESWRFVKQIFPILVVGVFAVGMVRPLIRPEWIEAVAGTNSLLANLAGVAFGIVMYFPTLVEVPVAKMFQSLGMHPGPLIAYLMADPELSLQSILMTIAIIGRSKTFAYVALVAVFSTLAGLTFGAWVDGTGVWLLGGYLLAFIAILSVALYAMNHRALQKA
ncbi:MAG: permease [Burkholderiales bacterium]